MAVEWWPVSKLWEMERSPRKYNSREVNKAENILRRYGVRVPLLISSDGGVLGHFIVVIAARRLGLEELPVIRQEGLSNAERKMLALAMERLYELGQFDQSTLGELFLDLEAEVPDLATLELGFDDPEVDRAIKTFKKVDLEQREKVETGPPVSKLGDIWIADAHRIACSDATKADSYERLMPGEQADMVITDKPFGCAIKGFASTRDRREFVQGSSDMTMEELKAFFVAICEMLLATSKPGALVYLFIDWRSLHLLLEAATPSFGPLLNLIFWRKDRSGMGSLYRSQHEIVLLFRVPGAPHRNNIELGRHGRDRSNCWDYPSAMTFRNDVEGDLLDDHATPKPKQMIADAILDCTKRGEIVLDPFLGSGAGLMAAEITGRVCRGMDLDPLYVDFIIRRWQAWTGQQAVHAETGRKFDDIERDIRAAIDSNGEASK